MEAGRTGHTSGASRGLPDKARSYSRTSCTTRTQQTTSRLSGFIKASFSQHQCRRLGLRFVLVFVRMSRTFSRTVVARDNGIFVQSDLWRVLASSGCSQFGAQQWPCHALAQSWRWTPGRQRVAVAACRVRPPVLGAPPVICELGHIGASRWGGDRPHARTLPRELQERQAIEVVMSARLWRSPSAVASRKGFVAPGCVLRSSNELSPIGLV